MVPACKVLGIKPVFEARYFLALADSEMLIVDASVARLPERLKGAVDLEYFASGSAELKGRSVGLNRTAYRQRVYGAQCALWATLHPTIATWMQRTG